MRLFKINYLDKNKLHSAEIWAASKYGVQKQIERDFPTAYEIYIWSI